MVYFQLLFGVVASAAAILTVTQAAPAADTAVINYQKAFTGPMYSTVFSPAEDDHADEANSCSIAPADNNSTDSLSKRETEDGSLLTYLNLRKHHFRCFKNKADQLEWETRHLRKSDIKNAQATLKNVDGLIASQLSSLNKEKIRLTQDQKDAFSDIAKPFYTEYLTILSDSTTSKRERGRKMVAFTSRSDIVTKLRAFSTEHFSSSRKTPSQPSNALLKRQDGFDILAYIVIVPVFAVAAITAAALAATVFVAGLAASLVLYPITILLCLMGTSMDDSGKSHRGQCFLPAILWPLPRLLAKVTDW